MKDHRCVKRKLRYLVLVDVFRTIDRLGKGDKVRVYFRIQRRLCIHQQIMVRQNQYRVLLMILFILNLEHPHIKGPPAITFLKLVQIIIPVLNIIFFHLNLLKKALHSLFYQSILLFIICYFLIRFKFIRFA